MIRTIVEKGSVYEKNVNSNFNNETDSSLVFFLNDFSCK